MVKKRIPVISGQHVQCGRVHRNIGMARSMKLRPWKYGIYGVKYVVFELEFWLSCCCVTCNLYCSRS